MWLNTVDWTQLTHGNWIGSHKMWLNVNTVENIWLNTVDRMLLNTVDKWLNEQSWQNVNKCSL